MRIDRLICYLRFAKTRGCAQRMVEGAHICRNGARVVRASHPVAAGDILTFPVGRAVCVVQIVALPTRRGPAAEAQMCYRVLDPDAQTAIAPAESDQDKGTALP